MKSELTDGIMDQAQVYASSWSLVGGIFDNGEMLEDAQAAKVELRGMVQAALDGKDAEIAALREAMETAIVRFDILAGNRQHHAVCPAVGAIELREALQAQAVKS